MKKLLATLLAAVLMAGAMAGCAPKEDATAPTTPSTTPSATPSADAPAAPADLTQMKAEITWWAFPTFTVIDETAGKYEQNMIAEFNAKYPNIKVNIETIDFTSGPEKIAAAIQGGTAPDILFDAPGRIVDYGKNGALADLNDLFTDDFKKDVNNENIIGSCSDGTNYYMYPITSGPFTMGFDKAVLEKEGLLAMVPTEGDRAWTTDEFTKVNEALKAKGHKNAIVFCSGQGGDQGTRAFISNLYSSSITNKDLSAYTINDANGKKAMQYVIDQVKAGNIENGTAYNGGEAIEQFVSGNVTSTLLWAPVNEMNNADKMKEAGVVPLALPLPSEDGKPELEYLVNGFCVFDNKDADKVTASKEFLKFICDDPVVGPKNAKATGAFPVRSSFGDLYPGDAVKNYYGSLTKYYGTYYNTIDGFATMRPAWFSNLQAALAGDKTADKAMDDFVKDANAAIAE